MSALAGVLARIILSRLHSKFLFIALYSGVCVVRSLLLFAAPSEGAYAVIWRNTTWVMFLVQVSVAIEAAMRAVEQFPRLGKTAGKIALAGVITCTVLAVLSMGVEDVEHWNSWVLTAAAQRLLATTLALILIVTICAVPKPERRNVRRHLYLMVAYFAATALVYSLAIEGTRKELTGILSVLLPLIIWVSWISLINARGEERKPVLPSFSTDEQREAYAADLIAVTKWKPQRGRSDEVRRA